MLFFFTVHFLNICLQIEVSDFNVTLSYCQPGYELAERNAIFLCECSNREMGVLTCDMDAIVLKDGTWAGRDLEPHPHLDITICPIPYCRCRVRGSSHNCENVILQDSQDPNEQCHPTRQGKYVVSVHA